MHKSSVQNEALMTTLSLKVTDTFSMCVCLVRFLYGTVLRTGQPPAHHHRASWSQPCRENGPRHLPQQPPIILG